MMCCIALWDMGDTPNSPWCLVHYKRKVRLNIPIYINMQASRVALRSAYSNSKKNVQNNVNVHYVHYQTPCMDFMQKKVVKISFL